MAEDATAFPTLHPDEIELFASLGERRHVEAGEYLYRQGDEQYDFFVIESGVVDIVLEDCDEERVIAQHVAGRFLGELNMLTGQRVFLSARVVETADVIAVPRDALRRVIATNASLGDTILAAYLARRSVLLSGDAARSIRVIGSRYSRQSLQVREFLARNRIPHEWHDPDTDDEVDAWLRTLQVDVNDLPVVTAAGSVLRNATPGAVAEYLGLTVQSLPGRQFDLVVVGAGPAGLAASVYGASEGLHTLLVDSIAVGGQAATTSRIENYLGFPMGISGGDLTQRAVVQAEKFGAAVSSPCAATSLREEAGHLVVALSDGTEVTGRAVIVATGARYRRLPIDRLEDFEGNGIYYAATDMEARMCAGAPVVVVGGGNSAGQAAVYLADAGSAVTVVIRGSDLSASMSRYLVDRIDAHPSIEVRANSNVTAVDGDSALSGVRISPSGGDDEMVACNALFSFIGAEPSAEWLSGCAALDDRGFVRTDRALTAEDLGEAWAALGREPLPFETSWPGLFAVGDVRSDSTKRVAAAVGEGSAAVRSVHEHLAFTH